MIFLNNRQDFNASEFREKMNFDIEMKTSDSVILMCAILIASIGLNMNSIPVIIGAMLISPLMTPILAIGYGLSVLDFTIFKRAAWLLSVEVLVSLIVAIVYFSISPISYASNEIIARTSPTIWDVIIAFAGGLAGIIGARKKVSNNIVPGVAIATALMPPLCTIGYSIATLNISYFIGSSYLFVINCSFIIIATFIGIRFMNFPINVNKKENNLNLILLLLGIVILIPSLISATSLVRESIRSSSVSDLLSSEFSDHIVLNKNFDESNNKLTLTISGKYLSRDELKTIEEKLPDYGLSKIVLDVDQVPDLSELNGSDLTKYLDLYLQNKSNSVVNANEQQQTVDTTWEE